MKRNPDRLVKKEKRLRRQRRQASKSHGGGGEAGCAEWPRGGGGRASSRRRVSCSRCSSRRAARRSSSRSLAPGPGPSHRVRGGDEASPCPNSLRAAPSFTGEGPGRGRRWPRPVGPGGRPSVGTTGIHGEGALPDSGLRCVDRRAEERLLARGVLGSPSSADPRGPGVPPPPSPLTPPPSTKKK